MIKEPRIRLFDLVASLSAAMDIISPVTVNHHKQVAYIAVSIAEEQGLPLNEQSEILLAGALHDSGALSLQEKLDTLQFEMVDPYKHAKTGYLLIKMFEPLLGPASLVRFHHVPWSNAEGSEFKGKDVLIGSHILNLADRIAVLINKDKEILGQVNAIVTKIEEKSGKIFIPKLVDAFKNLASKQFFWFDITSSFISSILSNKIGCKTIKLDIEGLLSLSKMFSHIIDFRSRFTSTHSSGVSACAEALAGFAGFSERECKMMRIAGYLHDLGKLAVPVEILEKTGPLRTEEEVNRIQSHTYYTYRILENIPGLETINEWASFHHERLDGNGYPFHIKGSGISPGSRIMAVADVFTAVAEDRPYRKGMTRDKTLGVLKKMVENFAIDSNIVSLVGLHFDELNLVRKTAQAESIKEYERFLKPQEE
ncbi:MAG: HD domain-containing protein [Firmicutes bacterium]|nr:HD domain-containing protein [Bacillota bacterium]